MTTQQFCKTIWDFYKTNNRDTLPWRNANITPYNVLVSEFMLQQTQVSRVLKKYPEFIRQFPTLFDLANASVRDVLVVWQGLGYNRRALALHKTAQTIAQQHNGVVPCSHETLMQLSGIGQSTAGALCAFAFNQPVVFIETNIRRVYIYFFFLNVSQVHDKEIKRIIEKTLDRNNPKQWYYALMDYGAMLAKTTKNPNTQSVHYTKQSAFQGSNRQIRSHITKLLLNKPLTSQQIVTATNQPTRTKIIIASLLKDGIIQQKDDVFYIE